ncbi:MAG: hypothetical protein J7K89_05615 [Candidatus Cloacimonetes bacterium]|nr:hypothetical protein [Candidatus Cloacimonadota bacterium]
MKVFFKKLFWLFGLYFAARFGYRLYRMIKTSVEIGKTLPLYLKNLVGEKPEVDINMHWKRISITLTFSAEALAAHKDLEATIREYLQDFYPIFQQDYITIHLDATAPESVDESEE